MGPYRAQLFLNDPLILFFSFLPFSKTQIALSFAFLGPFLGPWLGSLRVLLWPSKDPDGAL
jgi:hypothetical protein